MALDPANIAKNFTLAEIEEKITKYTTIIDDAAEMKSYDLSDTQSRQKVESHNIDKLTDILNSWLAAKNIKTGNTGAKFYGGRFVR